MTLYQLGILGSRMSDRSAARLLGWSQHRVRAARGPPPDHPHMLLSGLQSLLESEASPEPWRP